MKPRPPMASVGRSEHSIADASRTARHVFAVEEEEDARDEGWVSGSLDSTGDGTALTPTVPETL